MVTSDLRELDQRQLKFAVNHMLAIWPAKPLRKPDLRLDNALVAVLIHRALVRAFSKDGEIIHSLHRAVSPPVWEFAEVISHTHTHTHISSSSSYPFVWLTRSLPASEKTNNAAL